MLNFKAIISLAISLLLLSGCKGDTGPTGPEGPPGSSGTGESEFIISFLAPLPIIRADGTSTITLNIGIRTESNNYVVGVHLSLTVISGSGSISPSIVETNSLGLVHATYTSGTIPGEVIIAASLEMGDLTISQTLSYYLDPVAVSPPLLIHDRDKPLCGYWSADGNSIVFESTQYDDFALWMTSAQGDYLKYIGAYRGGMWNPTGDGRIIAYGANDSLSVIDSTGAVLHGPFQPQGFFGSVRSVGWNCDGNRLLVASNTNALVCVTDPEGVAITSLYAPVWVSSFSPIPGLPAQTVIRGSGDYGRFPGIYAFDFETEQVFRIISDTDEYGYGARITGASVNPSGTKVVYAARPEIKDGYASQSELFVVDIGGGHPVQLLSTPIDELYPQWSPNGGMILFCSNRSGSGYNLYTLEINP